MKKIFVHDEFGPEVIAMIQALYSRDPRSVVEHIEKVTTDGHEKFIASYYVGYGHKSIGDCGTTTVFVEQVSMLAAKALQDNALYNGQEASTRYLNMSAQEFLNPLGSEYGQLIQNTWREIYVTALKELVPYLTERFPKAPEEKEVVYKKAINAKSFDIARSLLPAGAATLLSWHVNMRQAADHLQYLRFHPLTEISGLATDILDVLKQKYPSSFSHKEYVEHQAYAKLCNEQFAFVDEGNYTSAFEWDSTIDCEGLNKYKNVLESRPARTELPFELRKFGQFNFRFPMDFGSFRDLQRHRSGSRMMPLLTTKYGFFPWYLDQFPVSLRRTIEDALCLQQKRLTSLDCAPEVKQYYTAMGYTVRCDESLSLPAAVYIAELRTGQTVHPTMRIVAQNIARAIKDTLPTMALHVDMGPDVWTIKRGTQDIVKKQ